MKIWLKRHKYVVLCAAFAVAVIGLLLQINPSEPTHCALCGNQIPYHAPVLINLATGEKVALRVYQEDPARPGELAEAQQDGYLQLLHISGGDGYVDGGHSCHVTVSGTGQRMRKSLYYRDCRNLLSAVSTKGYVLLDLHDADHIKLYPVENGMEYTIRDYTIIASNERKADRLTIDVIGLLDDSSFQ